jgi:hypothetical protein
MNLANSSLQIAASFKSFLLPRRPLILSRPTCCRLPGLALSATSGLGTLREHLGIPLPSFLVRNRTWSLHHYYPAPWLEEAR